MGKALERARERKDELVSLTRENARLRKALDRAGERTDELASLRRANARQGKNIEALCARTAGLEARIARLQSTRSVLSQALFGSKSEKQTKQGTGRKRGQQRGAPGHGRTPRPGLGEKKERRNPPRDARTCSCCGKPYVANGERSTSLVEIEARYHYLGYKTLVGAQMRYAVHDRNGWPLAMLGFSTAAWKLAPRDDFIGWTPEKREKNLPLVVDNPRFLILPWVEIPNLGSHILALVRRRLPIDWIERYATTPVLIETFVETPRYTGAVYRASGWIRVGTTQGRGRYDAQMRRAEPRKDIWLRPLRKDWKRTLNR